MNLPVVPTWGKAIFQGGQGSSSGTSGTASLSWDSSMGPSRDLVVEVPSWHSWDEISLPGPGPRDACTLSCHGLDSVSVSSPVFLTLFFAGCGGSPISAPLSPPLSLFLFLFLSLSAVWVALRSVRVLCCVRVGSLVTVEVPLWSCSGVASERDRSWDVLLLQQLSTSLWWAAHPSPKLPGLGFPQGSLPAG